MQEVIRALQEECRKKKKTVLRLFRLEVNNFITCRKEEDIFQNPCEKGTGIGHKTVHKALR